ncbi:hypothetical protein KCU92_g5714, partial [Aureobasidium melanogenum]
MAIQQSNYTPAEYNAYMKELEDNAFKANDWGTMLSAAPLALGFVGECMYASASPIAAGITLQAPQGGFKHLSWTALNANLKLLADKGRKAFITAEKNMNGLATISQRICGDKVEPGEIYDIMNTLNNPSVTRQSLPRNMAKLKRSVNECIALVKDVEDGFDKWLEIAMELSQAATQTQGATHIELGDTRQELESTKILEKGAREETARREAVMKETERQMKLAEEQLITAAKNIPSGWEMIGMSFVEGLTGSFLAVTQALSGSISGKLNKSASNNATRTDADDIKSQGDNSAFALEPAAIHLDSLDLCIGWITNLVGGSPDQEPDWDSLCSSSDGRPDLIHFVKGQCDSIRSSVKLITDPSAAAKQILKAVNGFLKILDELKQASKDQSKLGAKPHTDYSSHRWHQQLVDIRRDVTEMKTRRDNAAGPTMPPASRTSNPTKQEAAAPGAIAQTHMQNAALRHETAQRFMESQRALFDQKAIDLNNHLGKVVEIETKMHRLNAGTLRLSDIIKILRASICALSGLKSQITDLLRYFSRLSDLVERQAGNSAEKLLATLDDHMTVNGLNGHSRDLSRAVLSNVNREIVKRQTIMIRANFSVIRETAVTYTKVSHDYVMPGLDLVEKLGLSYETSEPQEAIMINRMNELKSYQDDAVLNIKKMVNNKHKQILERIDARHELLQRSLDMLPEAPNKQVIEAVATHAREITMTQQEASTSHAAEQLQQTENELNFADDGDVLF